MKTTWFDTNRSSWSQDTCEVKEKDGFYVSSCTHLTDFTLIVNGSSLDPILCNNALKVVNYFFTIGSSICLVILNGIFVGLLIPKVKNNSIVQKLSVYLPENDKDGETILYTFLQLVFYFNFTIFSDQSRTTGKGGCTVVAILNYWILMRLVRVLRLLNNIYFSCIVLSVFFSWKILKTIAWSTATENLCAKMTSPKVIYISSIGKIISLINLQHST